ncbi:Mobile element protein [Methanosarcina siciliae C2J]|uniref:Mobile element protein n=1 Tax=Methanosarcina siciliae C2J TaxID=1434118 RepID=A0A0E3PLS1_9EURY|nr:Mobile element protein [Methanosarcina siciliae C2J]
MFRKYDQKQQFLLPLDLEDFVPENHIARVLNDIVDVVDITAIESTYSKRLSEYSFFIWIKVLF